MLRDGPGNGGLWIAFGAGAKRQLLFAGGKPIATNAPTELPAERVDNSISIIHRAQRYAIP